MKTSKIDLNFYFLVVVSLLFLSLNSIFCKLVLLNNYMDAYSFTFFRIIFACFTLILISLFKTKTLNIDLRKNWISSFMLFLYAICFSYSYLSLDAGFGTLLLFAVVQIVMIGVSILYKEKMNIYKTLGVLIAFSGLVFLLYPKDDFSVSLFYSFLMIVSGVAWAVYSILGKNSKDALLNTTDNFIKATIFIIIFMFFIDANDIYITYNGLFYAFLSGAITSGLGYVMWYLLVSKIQINTAGILQLLVPVLSIVISVIFLDELFTQTLLLSTILVLLGVLLTMKR